MKQPLLLLFAVIGICSLPLRSQEISAGITGRVTDPSGSAIINANVAAKDLVRGTEWDTKTNEDGIYAFPRIPAGDYQVRVEASGFKSFVQASLHLVVNQRPRLDLPMEVRAVPEGVPGTATPAWRQTSPTTC